jgi:phosphoglycerol transferase MdoB-like AlkP superfamily enzyme
MTLHGNEDAFFEDYIQSIHYTDHVLGEFIEGLKAVGLFENTVIAIYGDHFGIGIENQDAFDSMTRFLERSYTMEDMLNIPLIIRVPGMETSEIIETTGGQVDFLPTILNIMGIENEYVTFGRDLLNEQQGFVASQTFMGPGSFIMGDIVYESSKDEVFENGTAYRRDTLEPVDLEGLEPYYNFALNQLQLSKRVTETDAVHELLLSYKEYRYGVIDKE